MISAAEAVVEAVVDEAGLTDLSVTQLQSNAVLFAVLFAVAIGVELKKINKTNEPAQKSQKSQNEHAHNGRAQDEHAQNNVHRTCT